DNIAIRHIEPVLVDAAGTELSLDWETFVRTDRIETIEAPNPDGFGSVIVAQRAYTDFEGRVRLPEDLAAYAGKTLHFGMRAGDHGINSSDSNRVDLLVLADEAAPAITIESPGDTVVDRQPLRASIDIVDNGAVQS